MQPILQSLHELDRLYREDSLEAYEKQWQDTARLVKRLLPGFTIAYAELYNSDISRLSDAAMSHVLVPVPEHRVNSHLALHMYNGSGTGYSIATSLVR